MSYLVGICGGSGSGKSTLAANLLEKLQSHDVSTALISYDDYYKHEPGMTEEQRVNYNFDIPEALDGHLLVADLAKLKAGKPADIPQYDFATQTRKPETKRIEPADVIIVEGVLIYAEQQVRDSFDLTIFVDAPIDVRLLRRIVRDIEERGHTAHSAAALYLNTVRDAHERYVEPHRTTSNMIINDVFDEAALDTLTFGIIGSAKR